MAVEAAVAVLVVDTLAQHAAVDTDWAVQVHHAEVHHTAAHEAADRHMVVLAQVHHTAAHTAHDQRVPHTAAHQHLELQHQHVHHDLHTAQHEQVVRHTVLQVHDAQVALQANILDHLKLTLQRKVNLVPVIAACSVREFDKLNLIKKPRSDAGFCFGAQGVRG